MTKSSNTQFVMMRMVPLSLGTAFTAPYTCLALGLAKISPLTAALSNPFPTNPAKPGSCPVFSIRSLCLLSIGHGERTCTSTTDSGNLALVVGSIDDSLDGWDEGQRRMGGHKPSQRLEHKRRVVVENVAIHSW